MPRILTAALAAAAALSFAAPAFAQDTMATMPMSDYPWCSGTVMDHCRQHEGMSGTMMHHGWSKHHKWMKHHRMMKHHSRMMNGHTMMHTAPTPEHKM